MAGESERSQSGDPIYRHKPRERDLEPAFGDEQTIERVTAHVEQYVGPPHQVFHELISDLVHVDIHWVRPTPQRNYHTLVTSGMSDRAMAAPDPTVRFAELMICLPPAWPLTQEAFQDERNYWPLRWLKILARLPHEHDSWLFASHTVPNGDPPKPFAENTQFCCALLFMPLLFEDGFRTLQASEDKTIHFLSLIPLYREEMDFKLSKGFEPLLERLESIRVTELLSPGRKNVCKKRWGLF
jgi:Suppressor of fused protein (SUFU)